MTQNELEVIRFIEEEYNLESQISKLLDDGNVSEQELQNIVLKSISEIHKQIAETLNISVEEAAKLYQQYADMTLKAALLMGMSAGIEPEELLE